MDNRQTERTPQYFFRCGYEDHLIETFPKTPKENEKQQKQVLINKKGNRARDNGENNSDQNIYALMSRMYVKDEFPSGSFGDSAKLTNWILDYGAT